MTKPHRTAKDTPPQSAESVTLRGSASGPKTRYIRHNSAMPDSDTIKKKVQLIKEMSVDRLTTKKRFGIDDKTLNKICFPVNTKEPELINLSTLETLSVKLGLPVRDITKRPPDQTLPTNHDYYLTLKHSVYVDFNRHSAGTQFLSWWPQKIVIKKLQKTLEELPGVLFNVCITNSHQITYRGAGVLSDHSGFTMITARASHAEGEDHEAPTLTFTQALKVDAGLTLLVGTWCGTDSSRRNARIFRVVLSPHEITPEQIRLVTGQSIGICDGVSCGLETLVHSRSEGKKP